MQKSFLAIAIVDIVAALDRVSLAWMLSWQDVWQRYRRSTLGPFWLTLSMGIMIATIGIVFGQIFDAPMAEFFPFLTVGLVFWAFISSVITDGCMGFISAEKMLKQLYLPLFTHILRVVLRNIVVLAHNILIFPIMFLSVGKSVSWIALVSIPGFLLVVLNLTWIALFLGILSARYRDLPPIVGSILQVIFYSTPIIWMPNLLPEAISFYLLDFNPVYHFLEVFRAPLLGYLPQMISWVVLCSMAIVGWIFTLLFYGRYKRRIAYWL